MGKFIAISADTDRYNYQIALHPGLTHGDIFFNDKYFQYIFNPIATELVQHLVKSRCKLLFSSFFNRVVLFSESCSE